MLFYIHRNNQQFGPYDAKALEHYVNAGQILLQDIAQPQGTTNEITVRQALKQSGIRPRVRTGVNIFKQIKTMGWGLLLPKSAFSYQTFIKDRRLLLVSIIGLAPAFLIRFTGSSYFTFYALALYVSLIWGMFFYSVFKTKQVNIKATVIIFFVTQVIIFITVDVMRITEINPLYSLLGSGNILLRMLGYVFGVGVFEELIKALPLFIVCYYAKGPLLPQTVVYYGLISGIGFGVFEGVLYQMSVNKELEYNDSFFMNIARLSSLPFLHAVWAAIAGYFISMSFLFPQKRMPMWILAILIPAILHGLYDTFTWSLIGLFICYISVALLIIYLQKAKDFQGKLIP